MLLLSGTIQHSTAVQQLNSVKNLQSSSVT